MTPGTRPLAWGPHKPHDGCEWDPDRSRGSEIGDRHFTRTSATVLVGYKHKGTIQYRLCADCARLPLFRGRTYAPIARRV